MLQGHQTWVFESKPVIIGSAAIGGPFEAQGNLAKDFDLLHGDIWLGQDSYEQAEKKFLEEACETAIKKAGHKKEDIQFFLCGDLINQIIPSSFTARTLAVPYLGIYGACSSSMEGLSLASLMIDSGFAQNALVGTSSHNAACEKQYRYPTEYGGQKPPTAQWTVTGAGAAVIAKEGEGPRVVASTIGRVIDMGLSDPFNMGAAMAPAAVDTIEAHFRDLNITPSHYDLIATGDLGKIGHRIARFTYKAWTRHPDREIDRLRHFNVQRRPTGLRRSQWLCLCCYNYLRASFKSYAKRGTKANFSHSHRCLALPHVLPAKGNHTLHCPCSINRNVKQEADVWKSLFWHLSLVDLYV